MLKINSSFLQDLPAGQKKSQNDYMLQ
jgi:hypothetical protein